MQPVDVSEHPLFVSLKKIGLPRAHYAIFGSGPMLAWGIRKAVNDLDIIARGPAWHKAESFGPVQTPPDSPGKMIRVPGARIDIFAQWFDSRWNIDQLIDSADNIFGFPFVPLRSVYEWKRQSRRERDREDVRAIDQHLAEAGAQFPTEPIVVDHGDNYR